MRVPWVPGREARPGGLLSPPDPQPGRGWLRGPSSSSSKGGLKRGWGPPEKRRVSRAPSGEGRRRGVCCRPLRPACCPPRRACPLHPRPAHAEAALDVPTGGALITGMTLMLVTVDMTAPKKRDYSPSRETASSG